MARLALAKFSLAMTAGADKRIIMNRDMDIFIVL
jgi:hypothetical protein